MNHRHSLPALLPAASLALALLAGCAAGPSGADTSAPAASAPAESAAPVTPAPAGSAAPGGSAAPAAAQDAWPVPASDIPYVPIENFAPAGVVRAMPDSQYGAASDAGYYDVCRQEDGSALLTFVDHATKQQVVLCSQPNCTHDSDACPAWYSCGNALRVYPIGGRLAVLQGGAAAGSDGLVPGLDVMNADGSGRQTAFTFPASCWVSTLPHYHMARDDENLYFVITDTSSGERQATLCAAHIPTGQVFALCGLPEDESHLVGGTDGVLVLEYTPGINQSTDAAPADTQVVKLDLAARRLTPLVSYPFSSALTACDREIFYLLSGSTVRSINLVDGSTAAEMPVALPEGCSGVQRLAGVFGGQLVAYTWTDGSMNAAGELRFFAIDPTTGARTDLPYTYTDAGGQQQPCLPVAETETGFLCQAGEAGAPEGAGRYAGVQYALVPKEAFWAGTADMAPMPLS